MKTISVTEFRAHLGKYLDLGNKEIFAITKYGKIILYLMPPKYSQKFKEDKKDYWNIWYYFQ